MLDPGCQHWGTHAPVSSPIHSCPPTACPLLAFSATACPAQLSLYLPAFLGHPAPPTFIHTTPCFVFMLRGWGWREGRKDDFTTAWITKRGGGSITERISLIKMSLWSPIWLSVIFVFGTHIWAKTHTYAVPVKTFKYTDWSKVRCVYLSFGHGSKGCLVPREETWEKHSSQ